MKHVYILAFSTDNGDSFQAVEAFDTEEKANKAMAETKKTTPTLMAMVTRIPFNTAEWQYYSCSKGKWVNC
jgi:hypothetical protein